MMKKTIVMIVFILFGVSLLLANPPKRNELSFNRQELRLKVKAVHPVGNVEKHHVKEIAVFLNDKQIAVQMFERQQNEEFQEWEFVFSPETSLPAGTELTVVSYCNIFGKKKTSITLE